MIALCSPEYAPLFPLVLTRAGWFPPEGQRKAHWFDDTGGRSLCWRWEAPHVPPWGLQTAPFPAAATCAACARKVARREWRARPRAWCQRCYAWKVVEHACRR